LILIITFLGKLHNSNSKKTLSLSPIAADFFNPAKQHCKERKLSLDVSGALLNWHRQERLYCHIGSLQNPLFGTIRLHYIIEFQTCNRFSEKWAISLIPIKMGKNPVISIFIVPMLCLICKCDFQLGSNFHLWGYI